MGRLKTVNPVKASESVVSRQLAKLLRVAPAETVDVVCSAYADVGRNTHLVDLLKETYGLYPWVVNNLAADIMSSVLTPLTEHVLSMGRTPFIAKDARFAGDDSIWLVIGDPSAEVVYGLSKFRNRGLFHTRDLPDGDLGQIVAIQLSSCEP